MPDTPSPITMILRAASEGDSHAADQLLPLVYDELRKVARGKMANEAPGVTLQPTALVHEAYLRVMDGIGSESGWDSRRHFFGAAALAMRRILVDQARARKSHKRAAPGERVDAAEVAVEFEPPSGDVLAIDEAVKKLEATDPRKGQIVNLRYFVGLTVRETAAAMELSVSTVEQEWRYIRVWLQRELGSS